MILPASWKEAGSVLVVTLMVTLLLTALTLSFSDETGVELNLSGFSRDNDKAYHAARSGIESVLAAMSEDGDRDVDTLNEDWARVGTYATAVKLQDEASFSVTVADESGKINLNSLVNAQGKVDEARGGQVRRLFSLLGLGEEKVEPLLDWLDPDGIERMNGAESGYYRGLEKPYSCGNGVFQTMDQLSLVKGLGPQDSGRKGPPVDLTPFCTIYTDGKININTASSAVLQSLSDRMDASMAAAIIDYRKTEDFRNVSELSKIPGLNAQVLSGVSVALTVKSLAVSIEGRGTYRDASCTIRAVAARDGDQNQARILYWQVK